MEAGGFLEMNEASNFSLFYHVLADFCFGYPFVMSWYWITGSVLFYFFREFRGHNPDNPRVLQNYPLVSVLLPCFNEEDQIEETLHALSRSHYPNYEIIAINDGSRDNTIGKLRKLQKQHSNLRVINLLENQGKSTALNVGLKFANGNYLVCIDGDALLDPFAIDWFMIRFMSDPKLGGLTGNPRIRNRSTLLGKLQVGEFSSIVGMIKRTQTVFGTLFTVSGVICAFRKSAVLEAGLWNPAALTDDVDLTLRLQVAGWSVSYVPNALCWILMPEKLSGLWKQRLRWAEGGAQAAFSVTREILTHRAWRLVVIWANFFVSSLWAYCMIGSVIAWICFELLGKPNPIMSPIPDWWGTVLACTYLFQSLVGILLDKRYDKGMIKYLLWVIWYPLAFWVLQTLCAVIGTIKAILRPSRARGTWISPDRGLR